MDICDVIKSVRFMKGRTREQIFDDTKLRSSHEILDEADLILRMHWAIVDARINNREVPGGLDGGVVYERHYALNWLIGYFDQPWDEVSTDT